MPTPPALMRDCGGFLAAAEAVGRDALERDLTPDELAARLAAGAAAPFGGSEADPSPSAPRTAGCGGPKVAPRVRRARFASAALPDEETFAAMLSQPLPSSPALCPEQAR